MICTLTCNEVFIIHYRKSSHTKYSPFEHINSNWSTSMLLGNHISSALTCTWQVCMQYTHTCMHINTCVDWCNVHADIYLITLKYPSTVHMYPTSLAVLCSTSSNVHADIYLITLKYPSTVHMYPTSLAVLCSISNTQAGKMYIHCTHVFTCVHNCTTKHWSTFFLFVQSKVVVMT